MPSGPRAFAGLAIALSLAAGLAPAAHAMSPALPGPAWPSAGASRRVVHSTHITIDGSKHGAAFQGIGAVSGGGGNSRLLIDYPPVQRQQILDYLFQPGVGASLQILKLEIGGDAFATDGAEPSVEHSQGKVNCAAGYEFWLAAQAVALNPNIQLYALQWNAPGWVGGGHQNAWTTADISYIIDWLTCASQAGLTINFIGGWNEHLPDGITPHVVNWFEQLRAALDAHGFTATQIVATDSYPHPSPGDIADRLAVNPQLNNAIGVLGYHNLCRYPVLAHSCAIPAAARASHKPIWESEFGALRQGLGAGAMARSLDNAYIEAGATGLITWPLVSSEPAGLAMENRGLVTAAQPWSGQYRLNETTWILAQTTEFTQPGWLHVHGANAALGGAYGSFNTYEAPDSSAWTMVAQTSAAPAAQVVHLTLAGGLPTSPVHVWSTRIYSPHPADWMAQRKDILPVGGAFSYTLQPGYIYTFTTVSAAGKGTWKSPVAKPLAPFYSAVPDLSNEPVFLAAQEGAFDYLPASTTTFEQVAVGMPVFWEPVKPGRFPYAVVGAAGWSDYTVSDSVLFGANTHGAGLIARFEHAKIGSGAERFNGYLFTVFASGSWRLVRNSEHTTAVTLASGKHAALGATGWVHLALACHGSLLVGSINGKVVVRAHDSTYLTGDAGISAGSWYRVQYQDLQVTP
jgi:hypothetical protein